MTKAMKPMLTEAQQAMLRHVPKEWKALPSGISPTNGTITALERRALVVTRVKPEDEASTRWSVRWEWRRITADEAAAYAEKTPTQRSVILGGAAERMRQRLIDPSADSAVAPASQEQLPAASATPASLRDAEAAQARQALNVLQELWDELDRSNFMATNSKGKSFHMRRFSDALTRVESLVEERLPYDPTSRTSCARPSAAR